MSGTIISLLICTVIFPIIIYAFKKKHRVLAYSHLIVLVLFILLGIADISESFEINTTVIFMMLFSSYSLTLIYIILAPKWTLNDKEKIRNKNIVFTILIVVVLISLGFNIFQSVSHNEKERKMRFYGQAEVISGNNRLPLRSFRKQLEGDEKAFLLSTRLYLEQIIKSEQTAQEYYRNEFGIIDPFFYRGLSDDAQSAKEIFQQFQKKYGLKWDQADLNKARTRTKK